MPQAPLRESTEYAAFDSIVTPGDIATYRASKDPKPESTWLAAIVILGCISSLLFIGMIVTVIGALADGDFRPPRTQEALAFGVVGLVFALPLFPLHFLNRSAVDRMITKSIRFRRFATANRWLYEAVPDVFTLPGLLFGARTEPRTTDVIRSNGGVAFTLGTHSYVTGEGSERGREEWGFITMPVKTSLQHVVLDAKGNNGKIFNLELFTNLPRASARGNELAISPEVDAIYRVYAHEASRTAISHAITPEFINKLKQLSQSYDLEIVDGHIYVYSSVPFKKTKEHMTEVMGIIDLVAETFDVTGP